MSMVIPLRRGNAGASLYARIAEEVDQLNAFQRQVLSIETPFGTSRQPSFRPMTHATLFFASSDERLCEGAAVNFSRGSIFTVVATMQLLILRSGNTLVQTAPPCGPTGGVTTRSLAFRFIGPTDGVYFTMTEELIGPVNLVLPASGSCIASCTMGPQGSCPGVSLPTFGQCTTPALTCAIAAGDTVLLTTTYI
jgi:hypothetical protein